MVEPGTESAVQVTFVDSRRQRPPHIDLLFDVSLRNDRTEARWFLLPDKLIDADDRSDESSIMGAEARVAPGTGRVVILRLIGNGRRQALLLPARAEVVLRRLPVALYAEQIPSRLQLEVVTATELLVDGEPAERWLGGTLMSDTRATVQADRTEVISSRFVPEGKQVGTSAVVDRRIQLHVTVPAEKQR
jgi:hypothetical protein